MYRLGHSGLIAIIIIAILNPVHGHAQSGDQMIEQYLKQETVRISRRFLDGAGNLDEWLARRPRLRQEYLDMLGLWPLPERTPLKAAVTGVVERADFVVEKLHFQSRPGLYVTGNLYRPKQSTGKLPAVLYVCGHSGRGRDGNKTAFQDHGMWFAANGYVCLVIDTLQLGEIPGIHHGTYNHGRWWWQSLGYTPAGVECWNGIRAIDYLITRPDVDADRIAVTGISGGGAATFWISAADERVKCAVPVSGMSDLESYVGNKVINGHCDCMFLVNSYGWEWTTIAALVAPRPLLFANSDNDSIFPMDGNRRIIARLRKLYEFYGKPELVDDFVSKGGHDYRPDLRIAIFKWINRHVKGDSSPVLDTRFTPIPNKELRVFPEDKDVPKDAINGKVDEEFVARSAVELPLKERFKDWQSDLLARLKRDSFRALPARVPPAVRSHSRRAEMWDRPYTTEAGIEVQLGVVREGPTKVELVSLLVLGDADLQDPDNDRLAWLKWSRSLFGDENGYFLLPRGVGRSWTRKSPPNYVERAHALLGRTVADGRLWDVLAIAGRLREDAGPKTRIRIIGRGEAGIIGAYAALLDPAITEIVVVEPPASHRAGPAFLNVLRHLDIPEALGLLAPRKLTLVNAKASAFDRTAQIYKVAGAEDKLHRN